MDNELVDIVDANNNVLYQTSKHEAHQKGLLHQTVISEIINSKNEFILVKQSSKRQDAGQFVSPVGGHVSAGETCDQALKREAFEECGLKNLRYKFKGKCIFNRKVLGRHENHYFMIYEIHSDDSIILNHESDEFKTFSPKELNLLLKEKPEIFGDAFFPVIKSCYAELLSD